MSATEKSGLGAHGGAVRQTLITKVDGVMQRLPPGTPIAPALALSWPVEVRTSLRDQGKVEFYGTATAAAEGDLSATDAPDDPALGQHGGRTLASLTTGGVTYAAGTELSPALVMSWPIKNRNALQRLKRVEFHRTPQTSAAPEREAAANPLG